MATPRAPRNNASGPARIEVNKARLPPASPLLMLTIARMIATNSSTGDTAHPKTGMIAISAPSALRFVDSFDVFIIFLFDYF